MSPARVDLTNFFKGWVDLGVGGKVGVDGDNNQKKTITRRENQAWLRRPDKFKHKIKDKGPYS